MKQHKKLGALSATAICGNDITSSCLYVSALTIAYAGQYAWIALLMVSAVLFLFRKIYGEVVGALPLNGGAYNVLLNTTSKSNASVAATLTILSYMATAVISASEAMHYLHGLWHGLNIGWATAALLAFFLMLTVMGITESAVVAVVIFITHLFAMLLLIGSGVWFVVAHGLEVATINFNAPIKGSLFSVLFLGFSTAMLGISGFESSANFVEEQKPGVFLQTLRNMWIAVSVINPLMALTIVAVLPMVEIGENREALLSHLGRETGGSWLAAFISIDAVLVLSGAVLTSYVGVSGLMKRMTLDRILPQMMLKANKSGSPVRILTLFFVLCLSILYITNGELGALAGVYTISFLLVMGYFGFGNFLLKIKRSRLPRPVYASSAAVVLAIFAVGAALFGNMKLHPEYLVVFIQYFIPSVVLMYILLNRSVILQYLLILVNSLLDSVRLLAVNSHQYLSKTIRRLTDQEFVYFTKGDDISVLNKVMMYVEENEITKRLKIVTVLKPSQIIAQQFLDDLAVLNRAYPNIEIEFIQMRGVFGPELIKKLSTEWNIPANFMFISSPGDRFSHRVSDLGGVRLIQ